MPSRLLLRQASHSRHRWLGRPALPRRHRYRLLPPVVTRRTQLPVIPPGSSAYFSSPPETAHGCRQGHEHTIRIPTPRAAHSVVVLVAVLVAVRGDSPS